MNKLNDTSLSSQAPGFIQPPANHYSWELYSNYVGTLADKVKGNCSKLADARKYDERVIMKCGITKDHHVTKHDSFEQNFPQRRITKLSQMKSSYQASSRRTVKSNSFNNE